MLTELLHRFTSFLEGLFSVRPDRQVEKAINKVKNDIARLPDTDLESAILNYETLYFDYIGEHHPEVMEFKSAVETRNIELVAEKWSFFASQFVKYEQLAGNTSRPYIMDCYFTYDLYLDEFKKRWNEH